MTPLDIHSPQHRERAEQALEEVRRAHPFTGTPPRTLKRSAIVTLPDVFQIRDAEDGGLIGELVTALNSSGKPFKEHLAVTWAPDATGRELWAVVDGHHRFAAYERAKWGKAIPVEVIGGTVKEACAESLKRNKENTAHLSKGARMEAAWRLVCGVETRAHVMTQKAIMDAAGVSRSQVKDQMVPACRELIREGDNPGDFTWALVRFRGRGKKRSDLETAKALQKRAKGLAGSLLKAGFTAAAPLGALVEALRLIGPALPGRLREHLIRESNRQAHWFNTDDEEVPGGGVMGANPDF